MCEYTPSIPYVVVRVTHIIFYKKKTEKYDDGEDGIFIYLSTIVRIYTTPYMGHTLSNNDVYVE